MKMEKRRLHGIETRATIEAEMKEKRAKIVEDMIVSLLSVLGLLLVSLCIAVQEQSKDFVTMENLEEKITECLDNEVNYNFALTMTGEIMK